MTEDQKYAEAREICARDCEERFMIGHARDYRAAKMDSSSKMQLTLAALNRGIEIERTRTVALLREENGQCDCFAREEGECACGAWDDSKTMSVARLIEAIEIGKGEA